jgi:hypothetical protein
MSLQHQTVTDPKFKALFIIFIIFQLFALSQSCQLARLNDLYRLTSTFENRSKFCFCLDLNVNFVAENNEKLATTKTLQKVFRCNSVLPLEKFYF